MTDQSSVPMQPTSLDIWDKKYRLKSKEGNPIDETIEDTYRRIAYALAEVEATEELRERWRDKFLWALLHGAIPAGRIISNAGAIEHKPTTSTINCTVSDTIPDSMDGILSKLHEAGLTLKAGCGIGYDFSTLRPRGAYVSGAGAYTSGSLSFMDIYDKMCFTISSAGGRRGAQMGTLDIGHPDVLEFIKAKREDGRLRQFNLSLLITEEFMQAVRDDSNWHLAFPILTNEETVEVIWRDWPILEGYVTNDEGKVACKVYQTIKARWLWDQIMAATYDYAEPGFILIDRVNEMNNNWWCENIRATNPCLHPDSVIETIHGRVRIADITEPTMVYTYLQNGSLGIRRASAAFISKYNAVVIEIETANGKTLKLTPDHQVLVHVGARQNWIKAENLKIGDRLVQLCRARRGAEYSGVKLTTEDNRAYRMEHRLIAEAVYGPLGEDDVHHINKDTYDNHIDNFEVISHAEHSALTASTDHPQDHQVFGFDGRFISTGTSRKRITPMPEHLRSNMKNNYSNRVVAIREVAEPANVYDLIVEDTHNFIANFTVVHNCGEQALPPYGSCLLGSVNLTKFVRKPFTPEASFAWPEYTKVVGIFTRMLDNVVEISGLPLDQQRQEILNKRRHGMGYLGLGSTLAMLGMRYGAKESVKFTEQITATMALIGWRVAVELAKEKGPAPILEQDFTVTKEMLYKRPEMLIDDYSEGDLIKGKVLHAKYSRYMQQIANIDPDLVKQLATIGARFTHHTSIAPTGTIALSLANNASNGIEPSFAHHYSRNIICEGKKTKEKVDVFSYELLAYRQLVDPNATEANLPDYFVTSEDITPNQHIAIQAAAQKWVDSCISKTANVPQDYQFENFKDIYWNAYEQGLKGCTTFRFNPEAFQGVLVKNKDLENTLYRFTLEDGSTIEVKGNEEIFYDGELHSAANLFDALKEGYYGKL